MKELSLISFFSGIGAFEKALDNLCVPYKLVAYCEIDKYASKSYSAIHEVPETMNLGDITKVDSSKLPKDIDLLTYGFPCQDISNAGLQKGLFNEDGSKTRSGLFFDALRIIEDTKPKIAIAENVKNLTSKRFANQFKIVLDSLEEAGYYNYWTVLNAKDFGVPQNRERVFIVSIRKDLDKGFFSFPEGFPLEKRLKDVLEDEVDESYFLSEEKLATLIEHRIRQEKNGNGFGARLLSSDGIAHSVVTHPTKSSGLYLKVESVGNVNPSGHGMNGNVISEYGLCSTLTTNKGEGIKVLTFNEPKVKQIGNCCPTKTRDNPNQGRIYDTDGISPALNCMEGGNRQPFVLVREATKRGYAEAYVGDSINLEHPNSKTRRGRVGKQVAQTLTTSCNQGVIPNIEMRIRKLTPKECFRLMGFSDEDFHKAEAVNSNSQLYKQAGNSIVVDVLEHLLQAVFETGVLE